MTLLIESAIKVSIIVLLAIAASRLLRNRSAAMRHWVLSIAIACACATPLLQLLGPSLTLEVVLPPAVQRAMQSASLGPSLPARAPLTASTEGPDANVQTAGPSAPSWKPAVAAWAWMLGTLLILSSMAMGLAHLAWLASRSRRIEHGPWAEAAREIAHTLGLRRPVALLQSDHPILLVTWGFRRPKVILPASAGEWSDDRIRVVLLHELSHVRRGDWLTQMTAECLRAFYWFNPLVWLASRRLRQESELACDDAVLNGGVESSEYATHLLELARTAIRERRAWFPVSPAPAMARPSSLERRFSAMLSGHTNRSPITRSSRVTSVIATAAVSAVITAVGIAQTFSTFSGTALDPTNRFLPDVAMTLTNRQTQAKHQVRTNHLGRFEFVGLPPGEYAWEAALPGFARLEGSLHVAGQDVQQNIGLQVGSLQETITVIGSSKPSVTTSSNPKIDVEAFRQNELSRTCAGGRGKPGTGAEMGGNLKAPRKLADFRPRYPERLIAANIGGVVVLDAIIDTEGDVRQVLVVSSPHPDLAAAAEDAVRQWRFSATILNCTAVEVAMRVTANFRIDQ